MKKAIDTISPTEQVQVQLLMKEYDHRFEEIMFHSKIYSRHSNFLYLYLSILVTILSLVLSNVFFQVIQSKFGVGVEGQLRIYELMLVLGAAVAFYFVATIFNALYMLYLNGTRIAIIERLCNSIVGRELLNWDDKLIGEFRSRRLFYSKGLINPNYLYAFWLFIVFMLICIVLFVLCHFLAPHMLSYYGFALVIAVIFHMYQWYQLASVGIDVIRREMLLLSGLSDDKDQGSTSELNNSKSGNNNTNEKKYMLVFISTILIGWLPMAILSIRENAFWFASPYLIPFLSIPSVSMGDLILLPLFNSLFFKLIWECNEMRILIRSKLIVILLSICLSFTIVISIMLQIHQGWISDSITGFMDTELGRLSPAGWWHLYFSTIQIVIITQFLIMWLMNNRLKLRIEFLTYWRIWKYIIFFTSISIADMFIRNIIILDKKDILGILRDDWRSIIPFIAVLSVSYLILLLRRIWQKSSGETNVPHHHPR